MAVQVWPQFITRAAHPDRSSSEIAAFLAKLASKSFGDSPAATLLRDVFRNRIEVVLSGRAKPDACH